MFFLLKADAILLIDVSVSFQFSTILDDHHDAEQKENIDADNAECGREDHVEIDIRKGGEWAHASGLDRSSGGIGACIVGDEHWRCAAHVTAAVELDKY